MARKKKLLKKPNRKAAQSSTKKAAPAKRKPAAKRKAAPVAKASSKGVDSVLRGYDKEKVTLADGLVSIRKKIEQLTNKIESSKSALLELRKQRTETEIAIASIDSRRDEEIGTLLAELGIDLQKAAAAATKANRKKQDEQTPTLFEPAKPRENGKSPETAVLPARPK